MTSRRDARRIALDVLFQADLVGDEPAHVLSGWTEAGRVVPAFSTELVTGVAEHRAEIDALLAEHAEGWSVPRMAAVDRAILRLAIFELLHRPDVPRSAAINEAVEAAAELSTEDSKRFVNGILGRIARVRPEGPSEG